MFFVLWFCTLYEFECRAYQDHSSLSSLDKLEAKGGSGLLWRCSQDNVTSCSLTVQRSRRWWLVLANAFPQSNSKKLHHQAILRLINWQTYGFQVHTCEPKYHQLSHASRFNYVKVMSQITHFFNLKLTQTCCQLVPNKRTCLVVLLYSSLKFLIC